MSNWTTKENMKCENGSARLSDIIYIQFKQQLTKRLGLKDKQDKVHK